jgi:large subunit ribosomal protein L3
MVNALIGQKKGMRQVWTKTGIRIPVTEIVLKDNVVVRSVTHSESDVRVQIGSVTKKMKNIPGPTAAQLAQAGIEKGRRVFKEVLATGEELKPGQVISVESVFQVGDVVKITGTTKGKGFAGVVKRYHAAGGPHTHGQSDRERAVGSIGQRTTPGRVFRNQIMPGHMGTDTQTLSTCVIIAIDTVKQAVWIKGSLPGSVNGLLTLQKTDTQNVIELNPKSIDLLGMAPVVVAEEVQEAEASQEVQESVAPEQTEETQA